MKPIVPINEFESELTRILQFWSDKMVDNERGGFYGQITGDNHLVPEADKGLILNARILWTFSAAYGYTGISLYKELADRAFHYLTEHFVDQENGGVYWMLDFKGNPIEKKKQIYAQAFAIYGLAEYVKVSQSKKALDLAIALFELIESHAFDTEENGYLEAKSQQWQPLEDVRLSDKDLNAEKTMNTHLHILEAYSTLLTIWDNNHLRNQLQNLISLLTNQFLSENHHFNLFFDSHWNLLSTNVSFGHDIEGSWLICEAAKVLGHEHQYQGLSKLALQMVDAALEGMDIDGGLMNEGDATSIHDTDKHWWPQAEALVGLVNAWQITNDEQYLNWMLATWEFTKSNLLDNEHGEWHWKVSRDGTNDFQEDKAGPWKCPYHNGRAMLEIMNRLQT